MKLQPVRLCRRSRRRHDRAATSTPHDAERETPRDVAARSPTSTPHAAERRRPRSAVRAIGLEDLAVCSGAVTSLRDLASELRARSCT